MPTDEDILKELRRISKIITVSNGPIIEKELLGYATTDDRKKIWVLIDGKRQSDEIAKTLGVTKRAVDIFLKILEDAAFVERQFNKPPLRILDYVPAKWVELLQIITKDNGKEMQPGQAPQETPPQVQDYSEMKKDG